ncbi:MAG: hypothetical protein QFB87_04395 [Patescibacteria group bacterium]|nr:hypothetical protein [Patescibacteria group bacterium]
MDQFRDILLLKHVYYRSTVAQICYNYLFLIIAFGFAAMYAINTPGPWLTMVYLAAPVILFMLARAYVRYLIVADVLASTPEVSSYFTMGTLAGASSMSYELNSVDKVRYIAGDTSNGWELYTAVFNFYNQTKYGQYLSKEVYYTVFEAKLTRPAPHLIFDSKTAKGSQFKLLYLQTQRLALEGDFNKYFDTYSPQFYQIDTLSFITPDVMEALIALQAYDIEIIDDHILCSGPLLKGAELDDLLQKGLALVEQLNQNLDTYHDNRLTGSKRKTDVTPFGRVLLKSPVKYLPMLVISFIALLVVLYLYVRMPASKVNIRLPLYAGIYFVVSSFQFCRVVYTNRQQEAQFKKYYQS